MPKLTPEDIRRYLLDNSPWVDPKRTVDTFKIGDPAQAITKAGVCWYPSIETIRAAHEAGCNVLITHEPTFWNHTDPPGGWRDKDPGLAKRKFLEATGMVVLRAHDSWDNWPEIGIRDAWARFLGFEKRVYASSENNFFGIYEVPKKPLRAFAQYVANKIKPLGEESVQVIGDPQRIVSKPAIGVGCITPDVDIIEAGADVLIVCYDGASYWATRERLHEAGAAIITVEHGTTEMPGLESLCEHLAEKFPEITFQYFAEHPRTWTVLGA